MRWSITRQAVHATVIGAMALPGGPVGCSSGADQGSGAPEPGVVRIVSLSPAITRSLVDFGLDGLLVGRTPYCRMVDSQVPIVGDLMNLDYEQLLRTSPTHVLVQPPSSGVEPRLAETAHKSGWVIGAWSLDTVEDIIRFAGEVPETLFDAGTPMRRRADERAQAIIADLTEQLGPGRAPSWSGRTLLVCFLDPVTVFGRRTYLDDLLVALGAENAARETGWAQLSLEDVIRLDPEAIVYVDASATEGIDPAAAMGVLSTLDVAAVRTGRLAVLTHADSMMPSTAVVDVAQEMRSILQSFAGAGP